MTTPQRLKEFRIRRRKAVKILKDAPCADCGKIFPACCMDFHHRDPSTKKKDVAEMFRNTTAWKTVLDEIEKCILICACCHRIRTHEDPVTSSDLTTASLIQRILDLEQALVGLQARFAKLEGML